MSLSKDMMLALLESDETKNHVTGMIKSSAPMLAQAGLGFAVPFLSPLIIAASSKLVLKGLELAGEKIEIAYDKIQPYKQDQGINGFLAKIASPCLGVLKKILPVSEKELYEALNDSSKLKHFFARIIEDQDKRQEFEEGLKKFLTGNYGNFEEFQRNVKETLGINVDRLALEAYTEFTGIIYNTEILDKIIALSDSSEEDRRKIEDSVNDIHKDFEKKYHEIKDEVMRLRDAFYESYGLDRLTPNYFEDYVDTNQDLERWKNGFTFQLLSSIKENKEFRRDKVVEDIKKRLEEQHRQLIVGTSGTSKSTIFMEIICDYYDEGYEILWNRGDRAIMNGTPIITFIERLLNDGNKVLVAVDNVHDERRSAIFYAMDQLMSHSKSENVRFILTARLPEYDLLVDPHRGLVQVPERYRGSIQYFRDQSNKKGSNLKYEIPFFTKEEIKGFNRKYREEFIRKYGQGEALSATKEEQLFDEISENIYEDTKGHPMMVKFSVFKDGLRKDVEDRYLNYLIDPANKLPDPSKIQTILVCSLLDISSLQITDKLLSDMKIKKYANKLRHSLLYYNKDDGIWKTIHPRWDLELISYLYAEENENEDSDILEERKSYLRNSVNFILSIQDEKMAISSIQALYNLAIRHDINKISIDTVENIMPTQLPVYLLNNKTISILYGIVMAYAYIQVNRFSDALQKCNKVIDLCQDFPEILSRALTNKGWTLSNLGRYEDAIRSFDKAIDIDPGIAIAWNDKGLALSKLRRNEDAIVCYDKAIDIDPGIAIAWSNKGVALMSLGRYEDAIRSFDKAIDIDPGIAIAWSNKGVALMSLGRYEDAIRSFDKAIDIDPKYVEAWNNKGRLLFNLGIHGGALECYDKAIDIDPGIAIAWYNKGVALMSLGRYEDAIVYYDIATNIDPNLVIAWNDKGLALSKLRRNEDAIVCYDKATNIDPEYADAWYNKGRILFNLGRYEEASKSFDKAIDIDRSRSIWPFSFTRNAFLKQNYD